MEADEIVFKEYVESTKRFHFGPLLCGKSREWYVLPPYISGHAWRDMLSWWHNPGQSRAESWEI